MMKLVEFIATKLKELENTIWYRSEEFFTSKDFIVYFCHPKSLPSKELIAGKIIDFPGETGMTISNFFKSIGEK